MKSLALVTAAVLSSVAAAVAQSSVKPSLPVPGDIESVAPALERYA
jgi:hypothetical protein